MGKRQIRFYGENVAENLAKYINVELNLIIDNEVTFHGKILSIHQNNIKFQDNLLKKYNFEINQITEFIVDFRSIY
ncbi:MAG: hypothetical protein EAZ44_09575 [Cytophagia bacterium]|nr:MAG: hypothetical protein EAZ44_09575 [Cytophagia bacterium]TAG46482.1 MAG: hypothetical protein EAZ31_00360 [Cytophagia bacterium]